MDNPINKACPCLKTGKRICPVLRWPGGKSRMLKRIIPLIPQHVCYCEPFAGGLAVLLAKERSGVEVINDINGDLVALYRNLQWHLPALLEELEFMLGARVNIRDFNAQPGLTEIQRVARFLVRNRTSFGGDGDSFGVARTKGGWWDGRKVARDLLGPVHDRLQGVRVEHLSYERCLELYDGPESFFFLDPPYTRCDIHSYKGWTEKDVVDLRKRLDKVQGQWLLTLDASDHNISVFTDCNVEIVETINGSCNRRTSNGKTFHEMIASKIRRG